MDIYAIVFKTSDITSFDRVHDHVLQSQQSIETLLGGQLMP